VGKIETQVEIVMPAVSVILCAHNPRVDYMGRVLDALKAQILPKEQWELLLIDNASKEPLARRWDLSWHPHVRVIREDELGLTPARLRGVRESKGELLVLVDDDNVLGREYLTTALAIADQWPLLGAFGGSNKGEFESPPPDWITPYLEGLVVCELDRDYWSNLGGWSQASPYGAGLCVRRRVAEDYAAKVASSPLRRLLGRTGVGMGAGEDSDIGWCAVDLGLGTGRFRALRLTHLIPQGRLSQDYIVRLFAGFAGSGEILDFLRRHKPSPAVQPWRQQLRFLLDYFRASGVKRQILVCSRKARYEARRLIAAHGQLAEQADER
jgi:glycosyltransferase involved in cell wall biosynthesis